MTDGGDPRIVGRFFDRGSILSGELEALVAASVERARIIPVEQRLAIKRAMIAEVPSGEDVWLFGYGSLIWNPAFTYEERVPGAVHGYHRYFSFWTTMGRGSPQRPGLMLALERGGSCKGVVFRIRRDRAVEELRSVFMRELLTGAYHPRWVTVKTAERTVRAITFVANRSHRNYAGRLPLRTVAEYVACAEGRLGRCCDYLINTVRHMRALGIEDSGLSRLLTLVDERMRTSR